MQNKIEVTQYFTPLEPKFSEKNHKFISIFQQWGGREEPVHSIIINTIVACVLAPYARSQGISSHGIDLILLEYSGLNTRSVNTLRQRWNRCHFADNIFKCIFLNENLLLSIRISLKFIPKGPINNIPALVQIMTWCRPGHKPLSEPIMIILLTYICITWPQWVNYAKIFHKWVFSSPTWSPGLQIFIQPNTIHGYLLYTYLLVVYIMISYPEA